MLGLNADIVAYGPDGQLVLIVEVVNIHRTSREWATQFRCNLLADGFMPPNTFFLFATPDCFYLWKNEPSQTAETEPTYEIDPTPFLRPVYERIGLNPKTIHGDTFEMIVITLLGDLLQKGNGLENSAPIARAFATVGLRQMLIGGKLDIEVPV